MRQLVESEIIGAVIPLDSNLPEENQDIRESRHRDKHHQFLMRLNSALFAIGDERIRIRGEHIGWNWHSIRPFNAIGNLVIRIRLDPQKVNPPAER
jgi:hypothetical protein